MKSAHAHAVYSQLNFESRLPMYGQSIFWDEVTDVRSIKFWEPKYPMYGQSSVGFKVTGVRSINFGTEVTDVRSDRCTVKQPRR